MSWISISATEALVGTTSVGVFGFLVRVLWKHFRGSILSAAEKALLERTGDLHLRVNEQGEKIDKLEKEQIRQTERNKAVSDSLARIEKGVDKIDSRLDDVIGQH